MDYKNIKKNFYVSKAIDKNIRNIWEFN